MTKEDIIKPENLVYKKPALMNDNPMHYCPGCSHGVVHKLVAEVIEEMGLEDKAIGISPVGCAVFIYNYIDIDWQEAAHGRAPALATAIKRLWPDRLVFTYQGDGDLACIGTAETIHALNRGENITIIFINNAIYGMTGGQMARELGLNPDKLGKIDNHRQEPWKAPLPEFIEEIFYKRFKKERPDVVKPLKQILKEQEIKTKTKKKEKEIRRKEREQEQINNGTDEVLTFQSPTSITE